MRHAAFCSRSRRRTTTARPSAAITADPMLAVVSVLRAKLTMANDASTSTNRNRYQCVWRGSPRVVDLLPVASVAGDGVVIAAATCIGRASSGGLGNETAPADNGLDGAGSGTTCAGAGSRAVSPAARV